MMFPCRPSEEKCEWSHLKSFVDHFNTVYKKGYTRAECLDVEKRNAKEPELLLKAPGEIDIVLEHKSVAWPDHHLYDHSKMHSFFDNVSILLGSQFSDSVYKLTIHGESLKGKKKKEVNEFAKQIAGIILANPDDAKSQRGVCGLSPIPWEFRPLLPHEEDEIQDDDGNIPASGFIFETRDPWDGFYRHNPRQDTEVAKAGYTENLERLAKNAAQKFAAYARCQKILLVQFYGDELFPLNNEDITEIIRSAQLPELIDQVYVAQQEWVSADHYEIAWERMR